MHSYHLPLKAPTPLPAQGVDTVTFKVWRNTLTAHIEQDAAHFHFMPGGRYGTWIARDVGKRIPALMADDPDKKTLDEKKAADPPQLTETAYNNAIEQLTNKRNAQLAKFITHIATLCYYTEHDDITMQSTSLAWIFDYLSKHYGLETKGANFLKIASITYKKGDQHQTFYKQYRASFIDNLRKQGDLVKFKSEQALSEDEQLSPSFENAIVLWSLKEIDGRLPDKVRKNYGHQMTGHTTLKDLQPVIFQNISSMLEELDEISSSRALASIRLDQETKLNNINSRNNFRGKFQQNKTSQRNGKFTHKPSYPAGKSSAQTKSPKFQDGVKFCRMCKLAGSDVKVFSSHEIGQCSRLTMRDLESLRDALVLNGMVTEEQDSSPPEEPVYFLQPGWDDAEAGEGDEDDDASSE